jgi:glycosyltransferase involved in cell wall biosynthesis
VMLGTGRLQSSLNGDAEELGIKNRVVFEGWQDPVNFLGRADALLVTSHYEGYGMSIVEALAAGVPVISTDVGIAKEAGAIVTSEKEFTKTVLEWLKNGPHKAELKSYPYKNFADYVAAYISDLAACVKK